MTSPSEEIKSRLDIVEVVREYIPQMKQAGANWRALCPFHNEKTPSFMVSRDKQIWYCFGGCNEGGDIFGFVMKMEGVEFPEALRILAKKAGLDLRREDPEISNKRTRLLDANEAAAKFFYEFLLNSPAAQKARDYLKERQISPETIEDFKIGFSPNSWDSLINFLGQKNFTPEEIFLAGLSVKKEKGVGYYDRFRGRLMFPIKNTQGGIVGFGGRVLPGEEKEGIGKYINSPQSLIYDKSKVVYNLDCAKQEIRKKDLSLLVEGYMDVIASAQVGVKNVVASSGTALTPDQVRLIKRYSENMAMAFDSDAAGESAAERGIDVAMGQGINVKVIELPYGKDPDDCIKNNPNNWIEAIQKAGSIMEYYFNKTFAKFDPGKVEDKKQAAKILLEVISKLADPIERSHWFKKLATTLDVPENILRETLSTKKIIAAPKFQSEPIVSKLAKNPQIALTERVLAFILKFSIYLPYLIDNLKPEVISDHDLQRLYKNLIIYYTNKEAQVPQNDTREQVFVYQNFVTKHGGQEMIDRLLLYADQEFAEFPQDDLREELLKMLQSLKIQFLKEQLKNTESALKRAELAQEKKEIQNLLEKFNSLAQELKELN